MSRLLGFILIIAGIYFLGQNIIFAITYYFTLPAPRAVLSIIAGVITLVFFPKVTNNLGCFFRHRHCASFPQRGSYFKTH